MRPSEPESLRVLVTGGAGGVGTAVVEHLAGRSCRVGAVDLDFSSWSAAGLTGVESVACDLTSADAAGIVSEVVSRIGGLDAVVHAAAILDNLHRAHRFSRQDWDRELDLNLGAAFRIAQAAYPYLCQARAPRVVFISSIAGELGQPGQVAYSASKAGLLGMMRTLALEWGSDGISVNAVVPGVVDTRKVQRLPTRIRDAYLERIPLGRFCEPQEVAGVIAFLLSPAAAYITGAIIRVDGGFGLNTLSLAAGGGGAET